MIKYVHIIPQLSDTGSLLITRLNDKTCSMNNVSMNILSYSIWCIDNLYLIPRKDTGWWSDAFTTKEGSVCQWNIKDP